MAFVQSELALHGYNGAVTDAPFREYVYTNSGADTVTATGFFNAAAEELGVGNTIYVINTGVTFRVSAISGAGVVTVVANYAAPQ
jgi:hypothetical protein